MKIIIVAICLALLLMSLKSNSQIRALNSYNELINFQDSMKTDKEVIVWGYFGYWGKYSGVYKQCCKGVLNKIEYSKITSCLEFKLFSDTSNVYYLPFRNSDISKMNFTNNDLIKMKVRLYKGCKMTNHKVFFLIEDILSF